MAIAAVGVGEVLRAKLPGAVMVPGDPGYDKARHVWNGMIDRRPAVIVQPKSAAEIVTIVNVAREHGVPVAIRGGGHNAAGLAVPDDGIMIDLVNLKAVEVDPARRIARVQAGATWADLDQATGALGLATTGGGVSTTGVAGLTLGGGIGWLGRSYGLTCDNLLAADVVTADGRILRASATENADLFWGLRGGGGNFAIVTTFEFQLHPVSTVLGGMLVHPLPRARELLRFYREYVKTAPDALTVFVGFMTPPDGMPIVACLVCYNGPIEEGERVIAPLRAFGPPVADQVGPMPYVALQSMMDEAFPPGLQVYWRSDFLAGLGDDAVETIVSRIESASSPFTAVLLEQLGGAVNRVDRDAMAFDHRDAAFNLAIIARWGDPGEAEPHIRWTRDFSTALKPFAQGVYVNYLGVGEGDDRVRAAYGAAKYERLVALKDRYDPTNVFRFNQNIRPSVGG